MAGRTATRHCVRQSNFDPCRKSLLHDRKEQLAMVYGLRQFRPYILGHRTVVRSDHAALMFLKRAKEMVGQKARLLDVIDFIEQFTLDLQHRRGASDNNADALSRRPCTHRATRAGSVLDFRTIGRILRRRRRAFRPKISRWRDRKCRETLHSQAKSSLRSYNWQDE